MCTKITFLKETIIVLFFLHSPPPSSFFFFNFFFLYFFFPSPFFLIPFWPPAHGARCAGRGWGDKGGGLLPVGNADGGGGKEEEEEEEEASEGAPHTSLDVLGLEEKAEGMQPQQASQSDFWMSGLRKA